MPRIEPLYDRVIAKRVDREKVTEGGIHLPDNIDQTTKLNEGLVLAVGVGRAGQPMVVKVGDAVLFGQFAGTDISLEGETFLVMREDEVMAIIHEDAPGQQ